MGPTLFSMLVSMVRTPTELSSSKPTDLQGGGEGGGGGRKVTRLP